MNDVRKEYTFLWLIENYSHCSHSIGQSLFSPEFTGPKGTVWDLEIFPRGENDGCKGNISLFVNRSEVDDGPEIITLRYKLIMFGADESILFSCICIVNFEKGDCYGIPEFLYRDRVFSSISVEDLRQDTLRVMCEFWTDEENLQQLFAQQVLKQQIAARTRLGIERISFVHVIESFSTLEPNHKKTIQVTSGSKNGLDLSSSFYYTDDSLCEGRIIVEVTPSDANKILLRYKISLVDTAGKVIVCGEADNRFHDSRKNIEQLPLPLKRQLILARKSMYLPDDKLSMRFDCIFSTGIEFQKIERTLYALPEVSLNELSGNDQNQDLYNPAEYLNACPSALNEFKALYINQLLTDVEFKTKTKSFPAHKNILCARSSVFEAMLTNDMKEKNTNCIQIDDLEDDILHQLLLFLYSDYVENLQWDSAMKLYYAGDKYAVEKLKVVCATYLLDNINTSTAIELLLLADTHNDTYLKQAVEDFILKHEIDVYGSEEWRNLIETNSLLVSKTMCLKYRRN